LLLAEKGRVELHPQASDWISRALTQLPLKEASLTHEIALETRNVHLPHRDPVDIFLVATARVLGLTLATADRRLLAANGISTLANR
jgi:PIN domain nuclease of toxin-antitoxin system